MTQPRPRTRRIAILGIAAAALALSACGGGSGFDDEPTDGTTGSAEPGDDTGPVELSMLIASSGDAETNAVNEAVDAWEEESGNTVEVVVAQDMAQQLAQGFAGGNPPDVFYL